MQLHPLKAVTIIAEMVLQDQILKKTLELGATGYSCHVTDGYGSRGARSDGLNDDNVQITIICPEDVAVAILTYVSKHYFEKYACIAWTSDVQVVRGDHYIAK